MVERMNRTILQILRCFIRGQQEDLDLHLAAVCMAIRSTVNRQTGFTPNSLMSKSTAHLVRSLDCATSDFICFVSYC